MADIFACSVAQAEVGCCAANSGRFDTALWWLAHEHQAGDRHALTITDVVEVGAAANSAPKRFAAQEGEGVLAQVRPLAR
jgi:hypothetical protein